eukprot:806859-Alexandrium_andersonii.AAC.1
MIIAAVPEGSKRFRLTSQGDWSNSRALPSRELRRSVLQDTLQRALQSSPRARSQPTERGRVQ